MFWQFLITIIACYEQGIFGLFWDDDDGESMRQCWKSQGGGMIKSFPVYYMNPYSEGAFTKK